VTGLADSNPDDYEPGPLGWHVIRGEHLLESLRRCQHGKEADLVFAELWANADREDVSGS
jgi:hypothetical protein